MEIKNLAQFLREAKNLSLTMIQHDWYPNGKSIGVKRRIKKVQTNGIQFVPIEEGSDGSWLYFYPRAVRFNPSLGVMIVSLEGSDFDKVMVYQLEES